MSSKVLQLQRQVGAAHSSGILENHSRMPVSTPARDASSEELKPVETFWQDHATPSLDFTPIKGPTTWTTLRPLGACIIPVLASLLKRCHKHDSWMQAVMSWQSILLPIGVILVDLSGCDIAPSTRVSFGDASNFAIRSWPVDFHKDDATGEMIYTVTRDKPLQPAYHHCLDLSKMYVLPTEVVSPARTSHLSFDAMGGRCVAWRLTGLPVKVMEHAASHCFWRIPKYQLDKVARSLGVKVSTDIFQLLLAILEKVFPHYDCDQIAAIMSLRCKPAENLTTDELPAEVREDLVDRQEQKDVEVLFV